jgi:hypothetical protein
VGAHRRAEAIRRDQLSDRDVGRQATHESFPWSDAAEVLADIHAASPLEIGEDPGSLIAEGVKVVLPLVLPVPSPPLSVDTYIEALPVELGSHLIVLLQAGAASLGLFDEGVSLETKSIKKYVVRGKGRAQAAFLKTSGKSRYGSRLRLQNARSLLVDVNERLSEWRDVYGEPEAKFYSAPQRTWPDLFQAAAQPAYRDPHDWRRIPRDLPVPTSDLLQRVYRGLCYGRVERSVD